MYSNMQRYIFFVTLQFFFLIKETFLRTPKGWAMNNAVKTFGAVCNKVIMA